MGLGHAHQPSQVASSPSAGLADVGKGPLAPLTTPTVQPFALGSGAPASVSPECGFVLAGFVRPVPALLLSFRDVGPDLPLSASGQESVVMVAHVGNQLLDRCMTAGLDQVRLRLDQRLRSRRSIASVRRGPAIPLACRFDVDRGSQSGLIQVMSTYIISEAKPKLGSLVKQAAAGKTIYLLNGKDMVALVPAHPTHDAIAKLDAPAINRRLAASERTPSAPWTPGDAGRLAKQVLQRKQAR